MTSFQLPLSEQAHRNQQLFSDYYLNHILPQRPDWKLLAGTAAPLLQQLRTIWQAYTPSENEAQTEDGLIKPVLAALGHTFEVQPSLATPDGTKRPDYMLYRDQAALLANKDQVLNEPRLQHTALAVGDAKYWERPLDMVLKKQGGDPFSNKNPSYQIAFYMQHSGTPWGILTNGRQWRLYHKDTAHKLDRFYEVDLPALLATNDPEKFLYFYAFFHRSAFAEHDLGLTRLLKASIDYARGIGDNLKQQVYTALRHLAQGFLDYAPNQLQPDPATLKLIYDHCLIVLYRLLFILYAEARELLPVWISEEYRRHYSLEAITREVARKLDSGIALLPTSSSTWARLKDLFAIINAGSPPLKVATFNGGLFDPQRYLFLEQHSIGDARLQQAIDMLARVERQFVDYRDLAERHLGTIYEGLLEHHLRPIPPEGHWTIDLFNDRGERKITGSYYTPDFVVDYIVDQTVGPLLRAAVAHAPNDDARVRAVLTLNLLDPSMGSGHFLVAANEYIARFLVDLAVEPADNAQGEADLAYWKRRVVQNCIYGVDLNPLAVDLAKLSLWLATVAQDKPLSFLDHHLRCGNALVGTRIAELEISGTSAKHPRRSKKTQPAKRDTQNAVTQISMLDDEGFRQSMSTAVDAMWLIERTAGNTVAEVREQERLYEQLRTALTRKYSRLADLVTATHFGVAVEANFWSVLRDYTTGRTLTLPPALAQVVAAADEQASSMRFFHWDLEFPEVFFDQHGQPLGERAGFDAVIGNPPYVRQEQLTPFKAYFAREFAATYHGVADLYVYFYQQGVRLLRQGGCIGYITSNKWFRADYGTPLRSYMATETTLHTIVDFGELPVFRDAATFPVIVVAERQKTNKQIPYFVQINSLQEAEKDLARIVKEQCSQLPPEAIDNSNWTLSNADVIRLLLKIEKNGVALKQFAQSPIYRGVLTGFNTAFVIDDKKRAELVAQEARSAELIKPLAVGDDIRQWRVEQADRWLIFARRGIDIDQYPAIKNYLDQFRAQLEPKPYDWQGASWPGRKAGAYKWYEIQDTIDYYHAFDKPKIIYPDIAKEPRFAFDESGLYLSNTAYFIVSNDQYLFGVLNSRVLWFFAGERLTVLGSVNQGGRLRFFSQFVEKLPIPDAPAAEREAIGNLALEITAIARTRYRLHERSRRRIRADLGTPGGTLNQKLTRWWEQDFPTFRQEIQKVFKHDIPLKERDDWEEWLDTQRATHATQTADIVARETELNRRVYALFDLTPAEIALIEASTKYRYGEV